MDTACCDDWAPELLVLSRWQWKSIFKIVGSEPKTGTARAVTIAMTTSVTGFTKLVKPEAMAPLKSTSIRVSNTSVRMKTDVREGYQEEKAEDESADGEGIIAVTFSTVAICAAHRP
jgi:hypothetical protein